LSVNQQCALGDGAADLASEGLEELVEQGLQPTLPRGQKKGDKDGEGQDTVAGEVFGADAVLGDEGRVVERLCEVGEDGGMEVAGSVLLFSLCI
jgi:hypothetical protein